MSNAYPVGGPPETDVPILIPDGSPSQDDERFRVQPGTVEGMDIVEALTLLAAFMLDEGQRLIDVATGGSQDRLRHV